MPTTTPTVPTAAAGPDRAAADRAAAAAAHRATAPAGSEATTRYRILRLVATSGPVSVLELARELDLTAAGVRRHVAALEDSGQVAAHAVTAQGRPQRGRPARRFVVTDRGQAVLSSAYSGLAAEALDFLAQIGGDAAVQGFAAHRLQELERRLTAEAGTAEGAADRAGLVALALADEGYAASTRPVPGGRALQLCQGHCPVQDVAARYPQLCEAETQMFSRVLGVHVQRLSTLAAGGHVCTTHVPTGVLPTGAAQHDPTRAAAPTPTTTTPDQATTDPAPAGTVEGTR